MQRFTYTKTGAALRSRVTMMMVLVASDIIFWIGLGLLFRPPWRWAVPGAGLLLTIWLFGYLSAMLRRFHTLDHQALHLAFTRHRVRIERADIRSAAALHKPLAPDVDDASLSYLARYDTLYMVASRRGLVALELSRPHETRVPRRGICPFTRVVLSLDDPEGFLAALGSDAAPAGETPRRAEPVVALAPDPAPGPGPGPAAIRLRGLARRYGDFAAVKGIDLAVRPGEVLAFLGVNGAGKTTTIRMMTGLLRPSAGQVLIEGRDLWAEGSEVRRLVGYVPDLPLLYESLTAREFLWLMAGLYGLTMAEGRQRAEELLAMMRLGRWGDQQIRAFSLGMKRKLAIAAALLHRPRVLLLDEVTNGLDPRASREVKDLIAAAARKGAAVFLTTHLLDLAAELAHRIAIIHHGEIRALGSMADLQAQAGMEGATLEQLFLALTGERPEEEVGA